MTTTTPITINRVNESDRTALYAKYSGQTNPQKVYIEFRPGEGTVTAGSDSEIGNAVPFSVWHGTVRRYHLPVVPTPQAVNELMEELQPLLERVVAGFMEYWDGSNYVGRLTENTQAVEDEIRRTIDGWQWIDEDLVEVWEACDFYGETSIEELGIRPGMTDTEIDELAENLDANSITTCEVDVIRGTAQYLRRLVDSM